MGILLAVAPTGAAAAANTASGTLTGTAVLIGKAIPNSATGCNQQVCIHVQGTGLFVSYVSSTGFTTSRTGCSFGEFLVRGSVRSVTNPVCWSNPPNYIEYLASYYPVGYNINNQSQVCVLYKGKGSPPGKPCETVHS
jgi:hypothetical protein